MDGAVVAIVVLVCAVGALTIKRRRENSNNENK